ncbi:MAG TPA: ATP-binding protein [Kofleriaceae bacterium]|nr:ATP-binding protein [Kofleriaceae bacterium]
MGDDPLVVRVQNLRALREVSWSPSGVCALVGGNGSGKTTLLLVPKLLRAALDQDLAQAVTNVFGGSLGLAHRGHEDEPITVGLDVGDLSWSVRLVPSGGSVATRTEELLRRGDEEIVSTAPVGSLLHRGKELRPDARLALARVVENGSPDPDAETVVSRIRTMSVFHDLDLHTLRRGSDASMDRHLTSRGVNAITMLRRWHQSRPERHRYNFVLEGLRQAFPDQVVDLDFQQAGRTLVAQFYARGNETPTPIANEANGVLAMMALLCAVAGSEERGFVAIDEPETALHPYAIRCLLRSVREWARQHKLTVVMATHSPVVLDEFTACPSQVYVMGSERDRPGPIAVDQLKNPQWLAQFRLSELQMTDELSTNAHVQ